MTEQGLRPTPTQAGPQKRGQKLATPVDEAIDHQSNNIVMEQGPTQAVPRKCGQKLPTTADEAGIQPPSKQAKAGENGVIYFLN